MIENLNKICKKYSVPNCSGCPFKIDTTYPKENNCYFDLEPRDWNESYIKNIIFQEMK